jgi:hypothetical protein
MFDAAARLWVGRRFIFLGTKPISRFFTASYKNGEANPRATMEIERRTGAWPRWYPNWRIRTLPAAVFTQRDHASTAPRASRRANWQFGPVFNGMRGNPDASSTGHPFCSMRIESPRRWRHPGPPSFWRSPGPFRSSPMPTSCGRATARTSRGRAWIDTPRHERHDSLLEGRSRHRGAHPQRLAWRRFRVGVRNASIKTSGPAPA